MRQTMDEEPIRLLTRELERALWVHPGRWVAITESELVAVGDSPDEVLDEAERKGWAREDFILEKRLDPDKFFYVF